MIGVEQEKTMKRYRIFGAKYQLSDKLMQSEDQSWQDEITARPRVFHAEITKNKKRVAFLTRNTYAEVRQVAEEYCSY